MAAAAIKFKTAYGEHPTSSEATGKPTIETWGYEINDIGQKELVITGETNVYDKIQEALEETKIENVINRVIAGDVTVMRANGQYIDTTQIPNNMIEVRKTMQNLENTWQGLPQEMRNKYNNSVDAFIAAAGTNDWLTDMGVIKPSVEPVGEPITKTETVNTEKKGEAEA